MEQHILLFLLSVEVRAANGYPFLTDELFRLSGPHPGQGGLPVDRLAAWLFDQKMRLQIACRSIDTHRDSPHRVHQLGESAEIDPGEMVYRDPGVVLDHYRQKL